MKMQCKKARKNISLALDSRLQPDAWAGLHAHLDGCQACRDWQKGQAGLLALMKSPLPAPEPSGNFCAVLLGRIDRPHQQRWIRFAPLAFRPVLLRAAMLLILIFSAWLSFSLSGRLDAPAADAAAVFRETMNLEAFADLPAESFGAVYEGLLQGASE